MNDPKLLGFKEFVKVNEGNYSDPDLDTNEWPGYEESSIETEEGDESEEARKKRLDMLFDDEPWNDYTGY
jgi:hypothetical protein